MDVNTTSTRPRNELLGHASRLAEALREHARATEAVIGLLSHDAHYLTSLLVAAVEHDSWEWMWKLHRVSHRTLVTEERSLAHALDAWYKAVSND